MIKLNRLGFILIFMFIRLTIVAQSGENHLREVNKDFKIALNDIIGNWYAVDSSASKISFINMDNYSVEINGINHGVGNYSFKIDKDSIYVNGTAVNWPPYDCTLKLLDSKHLEIEFYQYSSTETTKMIYRR